jgi:hypothetical protein
MGSILTGLNPVNKIGTVGSRTYVGNNMNTIQSQGFKLNTNNLSNINPSNKKEVIPLLPNTGVFNKMLNEETLKDSSGWEAVSLTGRSAWVPNGTEFDKVAKSIGVVSTAKFYASALELGLNTLDFATTGGTVGRVRLIGTVAVTAGQAKQIALGIRIGGSTVNNMVSYNMGLGEAVGNATLSQVNITSIKYFKNAPLFQNKIGKYAVNTSSAAYDMIHNANIFGVANQSKIMSFGAYRADGGLGDIVNFRGKIPKGSKFENDAFTLKWTPQKFLNPGIYELNKYWTSPGALYNGKFGMSPEQVHNKYELPTILAAAQEASISGPATGHSSSENKISKDFIKLTQALESDILADEWGGAGKQFLEDNEASRKEGYNALGMGLEYITNISTYANNLINENQAYKTKINHYQTTLLSKGEYGKFLMGLPEQIKQNIYRTEENVLLFGGKLVINAAQTLATPAGNILNYKFLQAQYMIQNVKQVFKWWNGEESTLKPKSKFDPKKEAPLSAEQKEKFKLVNITNTITARTYNTKLVSESTSFGKINVKQIETQNELFVINKASKFIYNEQSKIQDRLEEIKDKVDGGWFTAGTPLTKTDKAEIRSLETKYLQLNQIKGDIRKAVQTGTLKYDNNSKTFLFNKQIH